MMQDYPKLLANGDRVGFTMLNRLFCFSTCKNDLKSAALKQKDNLSPESAGICEQDFYLSNIELLKHAGVEVEQSAQKVEFEGILHSFGPIVYLKPSFGVTFKEIRSRFSGKNFVSAQSALLLEGEISVKNLNMKSGTLFIKEDINDLTHDDPASNLQFQAVDI
jgi:hypothetical protein